MDIGRAFGYPFKDQNWIVKIIIGTVIAIIPIVNFIGAGYIIRAIREIMNGQETNLPEWDDFGGDFMRGLTAFVGAIIYYIPIFIVGCCLGIMSTLVGGEDGNVLSVAISCCSNIISFGYGLVVYPMIALGIVNFAQTNDFSDSFFNFGARFAEMKNHVGETVMFVLFYFVISIATGIGFVLTFWICGIGFAFIWLGWLMQANLVSQYGNLVSDKAKNAFTPVSY